jgi:hypothetical protein
METLKGVLQETTLKLKQDLEQARASKHAATDASRKASG